jgi:hypothetical protein
MQLEKLVNDGWHEIVHHPSVHHHGCPTLSLPFPPPSPPLNPIFQDDHIASPVESSHSRKRLKYSIPEPELDKGQGVSNSSNSSKDSSRISVLSSPPQR